MIPLSKLHSCLPVYALDWRLYRSGKSCLKPRVFSEFDDGVDDAGLTEYLFVIIN